jgi:tRNA (cytidine/uridine-2'-O-)-methyltransferase
MTQLASHGLKLVLVQPQIAPNTGNIGRLCMASGTALHLVRPLGFSLSDSMLKRSGLDYWPRLKPVIHDDENAFLNMVRDQPGQKWLFSSKGTQNFWQARFISHDWLIFGSETHGLSDTLLQRYPQTVLKIPQVEQERCLNLATAAGIGLYEALRQLAFPPNHRQS